jgi:hypothetical protein
MSQFIRPFSFVIPGRREAANPESRSRLGKCVWIPGPALTRRPGMTENYGAKPCDS